jgi:predicted nucleic acid-binding protein
MKDKYFADSNIWLYLLQNDLHKKQIALNLLTQKLTISTQVLNENSNVCLRKFKMTLPNTLLHIQNLCAKCYVVSFDQQTIEKAFEICQVYHYSYFDSLIIATALENQCAILYSEDMHHSQVIDNQLTIINPFLP